MFLFQFMRQPESRNDIVTQSNNLLIRSPTTEGQQSVNRAINNFISTYNENRNTLTPQQVERASQMLQWAQEYRRSGNDENARLCLQIAELNMQPNPSIARQNMDAILDQLARNRAPRDINSTLPPNIVPVRR
ncbi:MAG: hypothetical protein ACP5N9_02385 [Candidatus Bilamarchaeum sp.]|jgi:hypothetical protein